MILFNNAILNCMPGYEDLAHDELDEFMKKGFEDRIQVLKEKVEACKDPGLLRQLSEDFSVKINQVAMPSTNDPFSGYENRSINLTDLPSSWKEMLYRLLLFFFATGLGYAFLNFPLLLYPIIYYKNHISIFLSIMQKDPDTFIDYIAEVFTKVVDDGYFSSPESSSSSSSGSESESSSSSSSSR